MMYQLVHDGCGFEFCVPTRIRMLCFAFTVLLSLLMGRTQKVDSVLKV